MHSFSSQFRGCHAAAFHKSFQHTHQGDYIYCHMRHEGYASEGCTTVDREQEAIKYGNCM